MLTLTTVVFYHDSNSIRMLDISVVHVFVRGREQYSRGKEVMSFRKCLKHVNCTLACETHLYAKHVNTRGGLGHVSTRNLNV